MEIRHARFGTAEMVRITLILGHQLRQDIRAVVVARGFGIDPSLDTEQAELGVGRTFELLVGKDLGAGRMIDGVQLDLIEIRYLTQFFGDANFIVIHSRAEAPRQESARTRRDPPGSNFHRHCERPAEPLPEHR